MSFWSVVLESQKLDFLICAMTFFFCTQKREIIIFFHFPTSHLPIEKMTSPTLIDLNVGGSFFTTTKQTLTAVSNSFLSSLIEGRIPSTRDREGRYFIDRDGRLFSYVLQFLRTHHLPKSMSEELREELLVEADFFLLE